MLLNAAAGWCKVSCRAGAYNVQKNPLVVSLCGCRIEDAESELRRLLTDHKRMYAAQEQQQEQEQHQQQAAVQHVENARRQHRR